MSRAGNVASAPAGPPADFDAAVAAFRAGRLRDAGVLCLRILEADPQSVPTLTLLACIQSKRGFPAEALACCDMALELSPEDPAALFWRGTVLHKLDRPDESLESFHRALAVRPDWAEAISGRGLALHALGRFEEAIEAQGKAWAMRADFLEAGYRRGNAYMAAGKFAQALVDFSAVLKIDPDYVDAINNRAVIYQKMRQFDRALLELDRAHALRPDHLEVINNRGNAFLDLFRFEEALACFEHVLARRPDFVEAWNNRANALMFLKRYDEALAAYEKCLALRPDYEEAHCNQAHCQLLVGDYEQGYRRRDFQRKPGPFGYVYRKFKVPSWIGEQDIAGKSILIFAEQGLGDTMQFCRYARCLAERGAKVILEVPPELVRLFSRIPSAHQVVAQGDPLPHYDVYCSLHHLPIAFGTTVATIPPMDPLLSAPAELIDVWRERLGPKTGLRVGVVCSGYPSQRNDPNRSMPLANLLPLLGLPCQFVSLQKEIRERDQTTLAALAGRLAFFGAQIGDFLDTAALASLMDLVITVDTSTAHLAGCLGLPTWVLLSYTADWRWFADRTDNPWYPTARVFRQSRLGEWGPVIADAGAELGRLVAQTAGGQVAAGP